MAGDAKEDASVTAVVISPEGRSAGFGTIEQ